MADAEVILPVSPFGLYSIRPETEEAEEWLNENCQDATWVGGHMLVEYRYLSAIVAGLRSAGLAVDQ